MRRPGARARVAATVALLGALALSACAAADPAGRGIAREEISGVPERIVGGVPFEEPTVVWDERGLSIAIVTWGSSSCPLRPVSIDADRSDHVTVAMDLVTDADVCTADMAATTHIVDIPAGADAPLSVTLAIAGGDRESAFALE